jgi:hypothetical protein
VRCSIGYVHLRQGGHFLPTLAQQSADEKRCEDNCKNYYVRPDKKVKNSVWVIQFGGGLDFGWDWPTDWMDGQHTHMVGCAPHR